MAPTPAAIAIARRCLCMALIEPVQFTRVNSEPVRARFWNWAAADVAPQPGEDRPVAMVELA